METIKGIKSGEIRWVSYLKDGKITHTVTSNKERTLFYLYEVKNGVATKTAHKSRNPNDLEKFVKR